MPKIKSLLLLSLCVGVTYTASAERRWPEQVYDCQVITESGSQGLVSLQSFSLDEAEEGVIGLPAITLLGEKRMAARVVQCIEQGTGKRFSDSSFQSWFASLDQ